MKRLRSLDVECLRKGCGAKPGQLCAVRDRDGLKRYAAVHSHAERARLARARGNLVIYAQTAS